LLQYARTRFDSRRDVSLPRSEWLRCLPVLMHWVPRVLSLEAKRPEREADYSPPSSEFSNERRRIDTPRMNLNDMCLVVEISYNVVIW
jgi:hypothetical protein